MYLGQKPAAAQTSRTAASAELGGWRLHSVVDSQSLDKQRNLNYQDCDETSAENHTNQPLSQVRLPLGGSLMIAKIKKPQVTQSEI